MPFIITDNPSVILKQIKDLQQFLSSCANIESVDATTVINMENDICTLKKEYVLKMHIFKDGQPRKINKPDEVKGISRWNTRIPGKKKMEASSEKLLIEKLFVYYNGTLDDLSFNGLFKKAKEIKELEKGSSTARRYQSTYNSYIDDSFSNHDIRHIDQNYIHLYILNLLNNKSSSKKIPTWSEIKSLRSCLNLTFTYALFKGYISSNPLLSMDMAFSTYEALCNKAHIGDSNHNNLPMYEEQINALTDEIYSRINGKFKNIFYGNGYAFLLSKETGMRSGELVSLKWEDIGESSIWIHRQQLYDDKHHKYYDVLYTKNDKKHQGNGRYFPLLPSIKQLLAQIKDKQLECGINSEYVLCKPNGDILHANNDYQQFLRKTCRKLGFSTTRNHAIRKYVNSFVLNKLDLSVEEKAALLGHSVEVNLRKYSFEENNLCEKILEKYNKTEYQKLKYFNTNKSLTVS